MGIKSKTDLYLPEFNFQNQNGVYISDADFSSKLVLVTFMYSNCKTECPSALNDLKIFENMFVIFSKKQKSKNVISKKSRKHQKLY